MAHLVFDHKDIIGPWVAQQVEQSASWGDYYAMGAVDEGGIAAGVVFNNFNGSNATCHIAVARRGKWLIDLLVHGARYAFEHCKLNRLTGMVEDGNQAALRLDYKIGFEHEFTMRKAGNGGQDLHVLVLWPENFRYRRLL